MIVTDEEKVAMRTVEPGIRMDGELEIVDGLTAGERVITEGHQKVGPGSAVKTLSREAGTTGLNRVPENSDDRDETS